MMDCSIESIHALPSDTPCMQLVKRRSTCKGAAETQSGICVHFNLQCSHFRAFSHAVELSR